MKQACKVQEKLLDKLKKMCRVPLSFKGSKVKKLSPSGKKARMACLPGGQVGKEKAAAAKMQARVEKMRRMMDLSGSDSRNTYASTELMDSAQLGWKNERM